MFLLCLLISTNVVNREFIGTSTLESWVVRTKVKLTKVSFAPKVQNGMNKLHQGVHTG